MHVLEKKFIVRSCGLLIYTLPDSAQICHVLMEIRKWHPRADSIPKLNVLQGFFFFCFFLTKCDFKQEHG